MGLFKSLKLRTKLIASFLFLALIASIFAFGATQFSLVNVTEDAIPSLQTTGQIGILAKTLQAETLEFVATGDEETTQQFQQTLEESSQLSKQLVELADDAGELAAYQNLTDRVVQTGEIGNQIIQSSAQTRENLEILEDAEAKAAEVLREADAVVQAEIARNLRDEDLDELITDSLPTQRLFNQFGQLLLDLQHEVLQFVASGEEGAVENFGETAKQLAEVRQKLKDVLEVDEPGEVEVSIQLDNIAERIEGTGRGVFEAREHTRGLLENFEELEGKLNEAITTTQQLANQDAQAAIAIANRNNLLFSVTLLVLAGLLGLLLANSIVKPIDQLVTVARQLGAGDLSVYVPVNTQDEIGQLAQDFNATVQQLRTSFDTVEQRTRSLELAATISDHFSGVLNLNVLLAEVVNQIKDTFYYYHAHIYLLNEQNENLVVAEGTGEAGAEMKAKGHRISLNAPTSLVARAARTGQIVKVDNVHEVADWLSNPLLPDTKSEMAVPIILDEQVVGVLDVQQNRVAGFNEGDANLLRTLANHVAVAIRNAYQFAEVETALAEAREAQSQYMQQVWERAKISQEAVYHSQRPGVLSLSEALMAQLESQAMAQNQLAVVEVPDKHDKLSGTKIETEQENFEARISTSITASQNSEIQSQTALVAPIRVQNQTIGMIQLYESEQPRQWSERELALVEVVTEQVAQIAESLRLFEEIREQAGREQTIREITDKLRTATNLEQLVAITTEELGQRLSATHAKLKLGLTAEFPQSEA